MRFPVFSRDSNPAIDPPTFFASKDRLNMLLATGAVTMLNKRAAQYTSELRDVTRPEVISRRDYGRNYDGGDNGRTWKVANQTAKGYGPGEPQWQMLP